MPTLSLSPLTVLPCSPLEQIDAAYAAGFDAVGLRLHAALPTDVDVMGAPDLRRAMEHRLSSTGLRVLDVDVVRIGPQSDIKALQPLLQYAGDLGATNLVFTSLPVSEYRASDEGLCAARIGELCECAARYGVRPVIEFVPFRGIASLSDALRVAALVNHPNLAICVDALHLQRSGGTPFDVGSARPDLLSSVQLCDAPANAPDDLPREARFDRLYPGEGGLPLLELLQMVPGDLPVSVEVPNIARAGRSPSDRAQEAAACVRDLLTKARTLLPGRSGRNPTP